MLPKLAKKFLPKLIPGVGAALTAYEAYQWFKDGSKVVPNPVLYSVERTCNGGSVTVIANRAQFTCNAWFANLGTAAANNTWPNHSNWGRIWTGRFSHIQSGNEVLPLHIQYRRTGVGSNATDPRTYPTTTLAQPVPRPRPNERLTPEELPILNPAPRPVPKPWPEALPAPGEQPAAPPGSPNAPRPGSRPRPRSRPSQRPGARPRPRPRPRPRVRVPVLPAPIVVVPPSLPNPGGNPVPVVPDTTVVTVPSPNGPPRATTRPGSSTNRRPPKGTYEPPKTNIRTVAGKAWTVINVATETNDFIGSIWKGVPKDKRTKPNGIWQVSPHQKLADIWKNRFDINWAQALAAYANNQFEDWVFGQAGMASGKASRGANITTGLSGAVRRAGSNAPDNETKPLPELVFDEEAGEVRIDYADWSIKLYG